MWCRRSKGHSQSVLIPCINVKRITSAILNYTRGMLLYNPQHPARVSSFSAGFCTIILFGGLCVWLQNWCKSKMKEFSHIYKLKRKLSSNIVFGQVYNHMNKEGPFWVPPPPQSKCVKWRHWFLVLQDNSWWLYWVGYSKVIVFPYVRTGLVISS